MGIFYQNWGMDGFFSSLLRELEMLNVPIKKRREKREG
jgi:hypothetical protein